MADKTTTIKVVVDSKNADRALEVLRGNFKATADVIKDTGKAADQSLKTIETGVKGIDSSLGFLKKAISAAFALNMLESFGRQLYDINTRFQGFVATMSVVTGSIKQSKQEFEFITQVANKYGVRIESLTATYAKLAAAGKDSALTHQDLHKIFDAMAMASNVLHLSMEETRLVFYALQQMVSKGNVTMEELRRQLAEKFPGAVNMMSEALEVPVKELERLIKTGNVAADDALPKFAEVILKTFGPASQYAVKTLNAEVSRLHNSWFTFIQKMAEGSNLLTTIIDLIQWLTKSLEENNSSAIEIGNQLAKMVGIAVEWAKSLTPKDVKDFFELLTTLTSALIPIMWTLANILGIMAKAAGPLVKDLAELTRLLVDGQLLEGLAKLARLVATTLNPGAAIAGSVIGFFKEAEASFATVKSGASSTAAAVKSASDNTMQYGKALKDQLVDAQKEYDISTRNIEVKLKERNATAELNSMLAHRQALLRNAQDETQPLQDRIQYYKLINSQEKDLVALRKEATQEQKEAANAYKQLMDPALRYVDNLQKETNQLTLNREQIQQLARDTLTAGMTEKDRTRILELMTKAQKDFNKATDEAERIKAENKSLENMDRELENLDKMIEQQSKYNMTIGQSAKVAREYDIAQLELALTYAELNAASSENYDISEKEHALMVKRVDKLRELIALKKLGNDAATLTEMNKVELKESLTLWRDLDQYTDKFFQDLIMRGKTAFVSLREDLKKFAAELASLAMKKFIFTIVGNLMGGSAGGQMLSLAANAGSNTVAGMVLNTGGSLVGSGISAATSAMGMGTAADFAAGWSGAASGIGVGAMEGATMMTKFGATMQGLLPVLGYFAIALAGAAVAAHQYETGWRLSEENNTSRSLGGIFSGGESGIPGATWMASAMDRTYRALGFNDEWSAILSGSSLAQRIFGRRQRQNDARGIRGFIGPGGIQGENWQDWSEQGGWFANTNRGQDSAGFSPAQNRFFESMMKGIGEQVGKLGTSLGVDSSSLLRGYNRSFNLQLTENDEDISQRVIAEFFASVLQEQVATVFTASGNTNLGEFVRLMKGSAEEIVSMINSLTDLMGVLDTSTFNANDIIRHASRTSVERIQDQSTALIDMAEDTVMTTESINALTQSTATFREAAAQMILAIENIKNSINDMHATTKERFMLAAMDPQQQYNYYQTETARLREQLMVAQSPEEVQRITTEINRMQNAAFGLLSPTQQAAMSQDFITRLEDVNRIAMERLTAFQTDIQTRTNDTLTRIKTIMEETAGKFNEAAATNKSAGDIQLQAAHIQLDAANTQVASLGGSPIPVVNGG